MAMMYQEVKDVQHSRGFKKKSRKDERWRLVTFNPSRLPASEAELPPGKVM